MLMDGGGKKRVLEQGGMMGLRAGSLECLCSLRGFALSGGGALPEV